MQQLMRDAPRPFVRPKLRPQHMRVSQRLLQVARHRRAIVTRLTNLHESTFPIPWKVTDAPAAYIDGQLKAIVGFELPISRIEGKRKFNQNRSAADQAGVVEGLRSLNDPTKSAVADFMQSLTEKSKPE